jgi:hypothetical protein
VVLRGLARDAVTSMPHSEQFPPLKPIHPESSLNAVKLAAFDRLSTEVLLASLIPGQDRGCLKTRRDGTILDGHHRICILRRRGVNVDVLPREIIEKEQ